LNRKLLSFFARKAPLAGSLFALLLCATPLGAQTGTHITGTFKTAGNQTPVQAGLAQTAVIVAAAVYGSIDFVPIDPITKNPVKLRCGGITYIPQPVRLWIRGDGAMIDAAAALGTDLIPASSCDLATALYRATITLGGSADGRLPSVTWTESKSVPNVPSVDWGTL
jgi:hypothetical protein